VAIMVHRKQKPRKSIPKRPTKRKKAVEQAKEQARKQARKQVINTD
jgi:hypothetical protein